MTRRNPIAAVLQESAIDNMQHWTFENRPRRHSHRCLVIGILAGAVLYVQATELAGEAAKQPIKGKSDVEVIDEL